ncbi:hypothetical protein B2J93_4593 [Marssonina coronariae]|uniref:Uncharacterized protein n=1 Tax=Diplocarpon coronariae TaxID=2795749 RepID=A0A218Z1N9_9HELO|nr:hypothetical protein B2J93_4593 [Marssonina coronariae]
MPSCNSGRSPKGAPRAEPGARADLTKRPPPVRAAGHGVSKVGVGVHGAASSLARSRRGLSARRIDQEPTLGHRAALAVETAVPRRPDSPETLPVPGTRLKGSALPLSLNHAGRQQTGSRPGLLAPTSGSHRAEAARKRSRLGI